MADLLEAGKKVLDNRRLLPTWDDAAKECGAAVQVDEQTGRGAGRIEGRENVLRYIEMQQPWRKAEIERSAQQNAAIPAVTMKDAAGNPVVVPEARAEVTARRRRLRSRPGRTTERIVYHSDGSRTVLRRVNGRLEYV